MPWKIKKDISGLRFGRWTVTGFSHISRHKHAHWFCVCDCGTSRTLCGINLRSGKTTSCGCYKSEIIANRNRLAAIHNMTGTPEHNSWISIRTRCLRPSDPQYPRYGGRGITICERWMQFKNFFADMGFRPAGTSIDRINNDGPYSPENCRWATPTQQANNKRNNVILEMLGRRMTISDWARTANLPRDLVYDRIIRSGWSLQRALTTPKIPRHLRNCASRFPHESTTYLNL